VGAGIRRFSEICFVIGTFLMLVAFFLDDSFFILNVVRPGVRP
jgi:choline-glycine betaine transporter